MKRRQYPIGRWRCTCGRYNPIKAGVILGFLGKRLRRTCAGCGQEQNLIASLEACKHK